MSEERIARRKLSDTHRGKTDWARVNAMTEEEIDEAARSDPDAQPTDAEYWEEAVVLIPSKNLVCLRIDQDILHWFQSQGKGFQARMNAVLRAYMEAHIEAEKSNPQ